MKEDRQYFKRYEVKYILNECEYREFRERTKDLLVVDAYGESDICNCYYDTPDFRLIRNSMEKGIYKEKLRLRSYGVPKKKDDKVFLELKKKFDGIVYKRREILSYEQAIEALSSGKEHPFQAVGLDSQIYRELEWVLKYYENLYPAMYIAYKRIAMYEPDDVDNDGLRVTFDRNLIWRTDNVDLKAGIYGEPILSPGQRIMEVKAPEAIPLWFVRILEEMKLYPTSLSKYGRAYTDRSQVQRKTA